MLQHSQQNQNIDNQQAIDSKFDFVCNIKIDQEKDYLVFHNEMLDQYKTWMQETIEKLSLKEKCDFLVKEFNKKLDLRQGSLFETLYKHKKWAISTKNKFVQYGVQEERGLCSLQHKQVSVVANELCVNSIIENKVIPNQNALTNLLKQPYFELSESLLQTMENYGFQHPFLCKIEILLEDDSLAILDNDTLQEKIKTTLRNDDCIDHRLTRGQMIELISEDTPNHLMKERILEAIKNIKGLMPSEFKKITRIIMGISNKICFICSALLHKDTVINILPCEHFFHLDCFSDWTKENQVCPFCNKNILEALEEQINPRCFFDKNIKNQINDKIPIFL